MSLTPFLDVLTDAVAGSRNVRLGQERASARLYAGLDRKMKDVIDTSPEMVEPTSSASSQHSFSNASLKTRRRPLSRTFSYESEPRLAAQLLPSKVDLHRSQSELPSGSLLYDTQTAALSRVATGEGLSEQEKRDYIKNRLLVWDVEKLPFPALPEMTGFSRYRVAVNADPEWKAEHFRKQVGHLGHMVAQLDMTEMTGMTNEDWQTISQPIQSRRDSVVSSRSQSSRTTASCDTPDQYIDPLTGTQVTRGFTPSSVSSARSSFLEGQLRSRQGSSLSMATSVRAESDASQNQLPQVPSTPVSIEKRTSNPLSTIAEVQPTESTARKIQKPCEFSTGGDPDSAVASDAEDEEEEIWADVVETQPDKLSAITQMIQTGQTNEGLAELRKTRTNSSERRRGRSSVTSLQRTTTVRALRPLAQRRRSSRSATVTLEKTNACEKKDVTKTKEQIQCSIGVPQIDGSDQFPQPCEVTTSEDCATEGDVQGSVVPSEEGKRDAATQVKYIPPPLRHRSATAVYCRPDIVKG